MSPLNTLFELKLVPSRQVSSGQNGEVTEVKEREFPTPWRPFLCVQTIYTACVIPLPLLPTNVNVCMCFVAGLLKVLIIGIYISFLKVPCVYSRPTNSPSCQNAMSGKGNWWINPNNYTSNTNENGPADDPTPIDKMKSLNPLLRQVNASLQRATESVSTYIEIDIKNLMHRLSFIH